MTDVLMTWFVLLPIALAALYGATGVDLVAKVTGGRLVLG